MELSNLEEFITQSGLYKPNAIKEENYQKVVELVHFEKTIRFYCPKCGETSVFKRAKETKPSLRSDYYGNFDYIPISKMINRPQEDVVAELFSGIQFFELRFECAKDQSHLISFHFTINQEHLIKTGQFPALAEYESKHLDLYKTVLSKSKLSEFRKAVGLFTHGIGIGSFVYLRRIFEDEIFSTYRNSNLKNELPEPDFNKLRMNEKIEMLQDELPDFLSDNKNIYNILSIGIHELDEESCQKYFPTLKMSIELILDEKREQLERSKKVKLAKSELSRISSELKRK